MMVSINAAQKLNTLTKSKQSTSSPNKTKIEWIIHVCQRLKQAVEVLSNHFNNGKHTESDAETAYIYM